jgi:hypothetical protein
MFRLLIIGILFFLSLAQVGVAQEAFDLSTCLSSVGGDLSFDNFPEIFLKVLPAFLLTLLLMRVIAAIMFNIAEKTETKADDKVAQVISTIASWMARLLSVVASISMPRTALMQKAEKIALKELKDDKPDTSKPEVG